MSWRWQPNPRALSSLSAKPYVEQVEPEKKLQENNYPKVNFHLSLRCRGAERQLWPPVPLNKFRFFVGLSRD